MGANLQELLKDISRKTELLTTRYEAACGRLREAEHEISSLREEIRQLRQEMDILKKDNEFLIVSHRLASSPDEIIRSRRLIAGWIRDIDKCISLLKE